MVAADDRAKAQSRAMTKVVRLEKSDGEHGRSTDQSQWPICRIADVRDDDIMLLFCPTEQRTRKARAV
ncbi:hypothetical protein [Bradyrhizobium sp. CCBAU 45389]|uniref:hypothetical protein n=1 Tax=Bradyrhizobium sp. CCBAU 45389 TaxID=858429 RepID=UPI0023058EE6|nr:hypothetical protein [Bradyrhizobium sp. CCBAU 45389]